MIKLKEILTEAEVSRELWYHIDNDISLEECVFRYGSPKYFTIINEARLLQCEQNVDFDNQTRALLETDLGKFGVYKGEEVALDFPMMNEEKEYYVTYNKGRGLGKGLIKSKESDYEEPRVFSKEEAEEYVKRVKSSGATPGQITSYWVSDINMNRVDEAKKKKDPPIGKPKRGGSKAYYVYVRDPKTKRIKKVSFGSGGLRAKINNPKARNAFAKRHRCTTATDKTTARYWSCRLPRYAKQLGIAASNPGGFW